MKKALSLLLVFVMLFSIVGCGKEENVDNSSTTTTTEATINNDVESSTTETTTKVTTTTEPVDPSEVQGNVWLAGQAGGVGFWKISDDGQIPVAITGNGQYTAAWDVQGDGTDNIECLILQSDFNIYAYSPEDTTDAINDCSVKLTIDKITLDGVELAYTGPTDGCVATDNDGISLRVNILNTWITNPINDIVGSDVTLTDILEVTFTVSGLPGGEVVTTTESTTTTTTTTTTATSQTPDEAKFGDINLDGTVALIDVVYLNKALAGAITMNAQQKANADCVKDGALNSADAAALLKYTVESIESLPVTP